MGSIFLLLFALALLVLAATISIIYRTKNIETKLSNQTQNKPKLRTMLIDPLEALWVDSIVDALVSEDKNKKVNSSKKSFLKNKFQAAKQKFLELSQEAYCECFPKIFEDGSNIFKRLIWAFLFLFFSALTCYLMAQNIFDYLR